MIFFRGVGDFGVRESKADVGGLGFGASLTDFCTIEAKTSLVGIWSIRAETALADFGDFVLRPLTPPLLLKRVQAFVRITLDISNSKNKVANAPIIVKSDTLVRPYAHSSTLKHGKLSAE